MRLETRLGSSFTYPSVHEAEEEVVGLGLGPPAKHLRQELELSRSVSLVVGYVERLARGLRHTASHQVSDDLGCTGHRWGGGGAGEGEGQKGGRRREGGKK